MPTPLQLIRTVLPAATLILLSACATLSKEECRTADWYTIGYEDGASGHVAARIGEHREACAKAGVKPDTDAYLLGRDDGLADFCRPQSGYHAGSQGKAYNGVCPADLEPAFLTAYREGKAIHEVESEIDHLETDLRRKERELDSLAEQISKKESELIGDTATSERRAQLLAEIREHSQRQGKLKREIRDLDYEIGRQHEHLDHLKADSPY